MLVSGWSRYKHSLFKEKQMYPYKIIGDIDLYDICLALGVTAALIIYRIVSDKAQINAKLFNFTLVCALFAVAFGYFSAVLVQAIYNIDSRGAFIIDADTGATFAGGLIGGIAMFMLIYFIFGKKYDAKKNVFPVLDNAACAVPAAHCIGRVGCLMAGCCYGKETSEWYGIHMVSIDKKVIPTQLIESVFLAILATVLIILAVKGLRHQTEIYMASYGTFRFLVEFLRGDYRGTFITTALSPSQVISLVMIVGAVTVLLLRRKKEVKAA